MMGNGVLIKNNKSYFRRYFEHNINAQIPIVYITED